MTIRDLHTKYINRLYNSIFKKEKKTKQWEDLNFSKEDMQMTNRQIKKLLNITKHQRNGNQNHKKISPHTHQNGYLQIKMSENTNVGKDVENRKPLYLIGGKVNLYSH